MRIVPNPALLPGYCINCKTRFGPKFIQTDILIENFGTVYFCGNCFEEIHRGLNYDFPNRLRGHELRIERLEAENDRLRNALANLDFVPSKRGIDSPAVESGNQNSEDSSSGRAGTKSGSAKSGAKQGSSSVRGSKLSELISDA